MSRELPLGLGAMFCCTALRCSINMERALREYLAKLSLTSELVILLNSPLPVSSCVHRGMHYPAAVAVPVPGGPGCFLAFRHGMTIAAEQRRPRAL